MKVRLLKKWGNKLKTWPRGQVLEVSHNKANELIRDNIAHEYTGEYPPKGKVKTDFFKPKNKN
jgi:hypothetical protein